MKWFQGQKLKFASCPKGCTDHVPKFTSAFDPVAQELSCCSRSAVYRVNILVPPCPPSEGNYRFALSFCHSVCLSFCLSRTIVFLTFLGFVSHIRLKLIARFHMQSFTSSSTFITATVDLLFMSYCPLSKIRFPDFSLPCLHISEWKFVASFHMKSYSSSLNSVTIDLLFH